MKKLVFGFCALMACFVFASCGGNPTDTLKSLADELQEADEISTEDFYSIQEKALNAELDFYSSDRSEDEVKEFKDALKKYNEKESGAYKKVEKEKQEELKKLAEKVRDAREEFYKKQKEDKKDKDKD